MRKCLYCSGEIPINRHLNSNTCCVDHSNQLKRIRERENYVKLMKQAGREVRERSFSLHHVPVSVLVEPLEVPVSVPTPPIVPKKSNLYKLFKSITLIKYDGNSKPVYCLGSNENVFQRFGRQIIRYTKAKNLKVNDVSIMTGIDRITLADVYKGRLVFDMNVVHKIKNTFDDLDTKEIESFLDGEINLYVKNEIELSFGEYIGHLIKEYRKSNNMTMMAFSKLVSVDNGYLSKIETGRFETITIQLLYSLCKVFQCDATEILKF